MKKVALHWQIIIAMILGMIWAIISGSYGLNGFTTDWIAPFGKIFINCLKFIAVPMVLFSIITGVAGLGSESKLGRIGVRALFLYLTTTVFAVAIGLTVANSFQPGHISDPGKARTNRLSYEIWALDNNKEIVDGKHLLATATDEEIKKVRDKQSEEANSEDFKEAGKKSVNAQNEKDKGPLQPLVDIVPDNLFVALSNGNLMLQVIFFAIFFGVCLRLIAKEKSNSLFNFFDGLNDVFIKMVTVVMQAAPFFVFCLMSGVLAERADSIQELMGILADLAFYSLVVVFGLVLLLFGFYPSLMKLFGVKIGYLEFFRGMSAAQTLAFSTSSSAATLPVTLDCVENKLKIPKSVSDLILPIGATVNMDGTSMYQAVAVIFLAQYHGVDLSMMQQIGILGTATLTSIGAAAVPGAGLIMLMIVLDSVGLNPMWIAIILPVDRLLDMCRTVINVTSDAAVSAIVARFEK